MKQTSNLFFTILFSLSVLPAYVHAAQPMATGSERQHSFSEIVGSYVVNPQGQYLGRIRDIVVDSEGHVAFAILARPGVRGIPGKPLAVPFGALSYKQERQFVLGATCERIRDAPVFTRGDLIDRKWAEDIYRYFGRQPYWTEGGTPKGR